ncbi:MAG TPA: FecR domain-containing protein [Gemmatimonadales bacterium]|nr:FecR domain-containing protein [Gemmatimonadales bacterium]
MTTTPPVPPSADHEGMDAPWELLARLLTGEVTPEERAHAEHWLDAGPHRRELYRELGHAIERMTFTAPRDLDVEAALRTTLERRDRARRSVVPRVALPLAALLVLAIGAAGVMWWDARERAAGEAAWQVARHTSVGTRDSLTLEDGTTVLLGPMSRLAVAPHYGKTERLVAFSGEALFHVKSDPSRPFRVHAGAAVISDLGTEFLIRSDSGQPLQVVVTSDSVRLGLASAPEQGVTVVAGQRGLLHQDGRLVTERDTALANELAWTQGRLVFDNAPLALVRVELRRWYGIELEVADSSLLRRHLTASFAGEPPQQVLSVIALALGAAIERRGGDTAVVHLNARDIPQR